MYGVQKLLNTRGTLMWSRTFTGNEVSEEQINEPFGKTGEFEIKKAGQNGAYS